jgi:D-methionine transport system permease protein
MNTYKHTFWEVLLNAFSADVWAIVWPAVWQTLYMTILTTAFTLVFGLVLGVILLATDAEGVHPLPTFNKVLGAVVNVLRSLPSMILIILTLPLSRLIIGRAYGPEACILALVASCVPMYARLVESSIREVAKGKVEAAKAMGTSNWHIITKVLLPEAMPSLIRSFTVAIIVVISTTALAGSFGAGGLGDVAVRFGYSRFKTDILIAAVLVLVALVQGIQLSGDRAAKSLSRKRFLI